MVRVRFEEVDDGKLKYAEVIVDNKRIIGVISTLGFHLLPEQDGSMYLKSGDLKLIEDKTAEFEKSRTSNSKQVA